MLEPYLDNIKNSHKDRTVEEEVIKKSNKGSGK